MLIFHYYSTLLTLSDMLKKTNQKSYKREGDLISQRKLPILNTLGVLEGFNL